MSEATDTVRVLHVDDDPNLSDMVETFLRREDSRITVQHATTAAEGVEVLAGNDVDCVVSDYDMPGQNGIEFLETVREAHPDLPFILYTGKGSEAVASEAISAGVSDYLQKESGTDQYTVLANRILNLVTQYRAEIRVEQFTRLHEESEEYRDRLLEIVSDQNLSTDDKIQQLLRLGRERFDLENGHLVMIDQERDRHNVITVSGSDIVEEGVSDLSKTYCRMTIQSEEMLQINNAVEQGWETDPAYQTFELGCYIGGKLSIDDRVRGTVCFVDEDPRDPFSHHEQVFFDIMVRWFSQLLERRELQQADTIFENVQDALFIVDVADDGTFSIQRVNRAYEELTGLSPDEMYDKTLREIVGDEQGAEVEARFQDCVQQREPIEYEEQLTVGDDRRYWQTRLAPITEDGTVTGLMGATRDITNRKKREQRYDAIFNQTYQFTGLLEPDGTLIEANETALTFGNLDRAEVLGKKMWDVDWFQHSEQTEELARGAIERAAEGEFVRLELTVQGADREAIIDFSVRPITNDEGRITSLVPEGRDITERKEYEQQLREEQEFVQSIFQSLPDPLYAFDVDGYPIRWNKEFEAVTGYSSDEIEQRHVTEFVPEDEIDAITRNFQAILEEGQPVTIESAFETKDGDRIPHEFTGGPLEGPDESIRGVTGVGRILRE